MKRSDFKKGIPVLMACVIAATGGEMAKANTTDGNTVEAEQINLQEDYSEEPEKESSDLGNVFENADIKEQSVVLANDESDDAEVEFTSPDIESTEESTTDEGAAPNNESFDEKQTVEADAAEDNVVDNNADFVSAKREMAISEKTSTVIQLPTYSELMNTPNLSDSVETLGHDTPGDTAGMVYAITVNQPVGILGNIAIPTIDGKWAVPTNLARTPEDGYDVSLVEDAMKRAQTFADADANLVWDPSRLPPLYDLIVHEEYEAPYPLTCSSFVGQVLAGWDYDHTTYVDYKNTVVGDYVDFGAPASDFHWQAWKLAKWFATDKDQGNIWLNDEENPQYQRGGHAVFFATESRR